MTTDKLHRRNVLVTAIATVVGILRDQLSGDPHQGARVTRLHTLVAQLGEVLADAGAADEAEPPGNERESTR